MLEEGPCDRASDPELTETPFLMVAVVSAEMLRAQEEWDAVDTVHPNIGKRGNVLPRTAASRGHTGQHTRDGD